MHNRHRAREPRDLQRSHEPEKRVVVERDGRWPPDGIRLGPDDSGDVPLPGGRSEVGGPIDVVADDLKCQVADAEGQQVPVVIDLGIVSYVDDESGLMRSGEERETASPIGGDQHDD